VDSILPTPIGIYPTLSVSSTPTSAGGGGGLPRDARELWPGLASLFTDATKLAPVGSALLNACEFFAREMITGA
jgi:hypothetical protein